MGARTLALVACVIAVAAPATARAQDSSSTVELVRNLPVDFGAIGAKKIGSYLFLTGTHMFAVFDVSDPANPKEVARRPLGYQWENEDVSANGRIMLISEALVTNGFLHVWDVSDPAAPAEIATLADAGNHTMECLSDCTWGYGSEGTIVDLRDPKAPKIAGNWMTKSGLDQENGSHDVEEVRPGLALVASLDTPWALLDTRDPLAPRIIARGPDEPDGWIFHSIHWPNGGTDPFVTAQGEGTSGPFITYRAGGTPEAPAFTVLDSFSVSAASSHWYEEHPRWNGGGLVAIGWYAEGTRFLQVDRTGDITEVGYFKPTDRAPSAWAAYWISDDVVYSVDNDRGLDVLRFKGEIPALPAVPAVPAAGTGTGPPVASAEGAVDGKAVAGVAAVEVARVLRRGGRTRLNRRRTVDATVNAPGSGDLVVSVTAGRRVVASGRARFAAAGRGVVHLRPKGRARGRLTIKARFTPDRGTAGSAKRTLR